MRVVFMGTPDFAVGSLETINNSQHKVVGVITVPDKPAGRGLKLLYSEVKKFALEKNLPLLQPEKLKDAHFIEALKQWKADVFVVVAFRMLPSEVYSIPRKGTFNVHASLLPQYRGAAPIQWTIMNGETKTGVTTFFLNNEIDCGDIILQKETEILPDETTGELYKRLKVLGATLALETLNIIEKGDVKTITQHSQKEFIKLAPKIHKEDTIIDWNLTAQSIINKIRGLTPYPGAVTFFSDDYGNRQSVKILKASITPIKTNAISKKITTDNKSFLNISSKDFQISIHNLQVEGKKRLDVFDFLQGNKINNYTIY
ncbi:MAG: methionyl-tRNA formyltransferase [Bacteroidales bacterium]|jgi:methionyl-tRNA formyltransferase|nr:methionyl-tRNA formyltransferase [Bacteroidales bacterium]